MGKCGTSRFNQLGYFQSLAACFEEALWELMGQDESTAEY